MKIAVMGYSGSGKSTLAKWLGAREHLPVLYLDTVQFLPNWQERNREAARAMVAEFMRGDDWVIDGNYPAFFEQERLAQADHIVYLNFSRCACLIRALRRYRACRNTARESMAAGCAEKFDWEFARWILHDGRTKRRRAHNADIARQYKDKCVVLKNQRQLDQFMQAPFQEGSFTPK
ncbi:MAG: DNA topology modulation protein [Clostridia bacterium]